MDTRQKLIFAVSAYDRQQSTKRGYNHYALAQYFMRVDEITADIANGADVRKAITAGFSGSLADKCLKAVGLEKTSKAENLGGYVYTPVTGRKA
jgi:hypothetical protein